MIIHFTYFKGSVSNTLRPIYLRITVHQYLVRSLTSYSIFHKELDDDIGNTKPATSELRFTKSKIVDTFFKEKDVESLEKILLHKYNRISQTHTPIISIHKYIFFKGHFIEWISLATYFYDRNLLKHGKEPKK